MTTIVKRYSFEAAHCLPHHRGKCQRLHGHSYVVEVEVAGNVLLVDGKSDSGMVLDFSDLSAIVKPLTDQLDHQYLNDVLDIYPTAEHLAAWFYHNIASHLPPRVSLRCIRLWETANSRVEYPGD